MGRPATTTTTTTARPRGWRHTVGLLVTAVRLVRDAHPHGFALAIAMQVAAGLGLALVLLLTRHALDTLLALDRAHGVAPVVLDLVALLVVLVGSAVVGATRTGLADLQVEHATRHVRARILDVAGTVDLEEFERSAFYDLLKRAIEHGVPAPYVITMSLLGLVHGQIGIVGVAVARSRLPSVSACGCPCRLKQGTRSAGHQPSTGLPPDSMTTSVGHIFFSSLPIKRGCVDVESSSDVRQVNARQRVDRFFAQHELA